MLCSKNYSTSAASAGQGAEAGKGSSSPELLRRKRKGEQQRCGMGQRQAGRSPGAPRGAPSMGTPGAAASRQRQGKARFSTPTMVLTGKTDRGFALGTRIRSQRKERRLK